MGGKQTIVEYKQKIVYRDDPKTIQALRKKEQELKKLSDNFSSLERQRDKLLYNLGRRYQQQQEQIKITNSKQYEQAEKKIFCEFLDGLKKFKAQQTLPKIKDILYFAVIGEIAAGKTTIYNKILGTKEEVGVDDTTQDISKVHQNEQKRIVYWDSPGLSQYLSITNVQCLKAFFAIDCIFIVTAVSFKNSIRTIQVIDKINPPKFYLVRNQCDKFKTDSQFQQASNKDKKLLEQYQIKNVIKILYVSMTEDDSFRDNKQFESLMTTKF